MATVSDIRNAGTDLVVSSIPLSEPLAPAINLSEHLKRFDADIYNFSKESHLFRFLLALIGDAGAGDLKKKLLYPRLQSYIGSTFFSDLNSLYGLPLQLPRLSTETYLVDPKYQALTQEEWEDVHSKDASYKSRSLVWMRALKQGSNPQGIKLAAEAAIGVECAVFERYKYLEDHNSGGNTVPNIGKTPNPNEIVIIPQLPIISQEEHREIISLVDFIKPVNSIPTVVSGTYPKIQQEVTSVSGSSNYFTVQQFVTGTSTVPWPNTDPSRGFWISANEEQEAPTFAFMSIQEKAVFNPITSATASSYHIGAFNAEQQILFAHLRDTSFPPSSYLAKQSYASNPTILQTMNQWIPSPTQTQTPIVMVNDVYPLDYFNLVNPSGPTTSSLYFWSSNEQDAGTIETLTLDMGITNQVNYIEFEICQKPIDIEIRYSTNNTNWTTVTPQAEFSYSLSIAYFPSETNPWQPYDLHFDTVQARYIQIIFTRRNDIFPFPNSDPFQWSIDVRNLRLVHAIGYIDDILTESGDYVANVGTDPLGNTYRTSIWSTSPDNTVDDDITNYWQSQPNPSPLAVESLYFDLSSSGNPQVVNDIYIDPLTVGPYMHIYWSNDDTVPWDWKLWTPIPRHYVLKRGLVSLPTPITAKYFKLEFYNLIPIPYNSLDYSALPPVTYRKFPTWLQNLYETIYPITIERDQLLFPYNTISIDPLEFGFLINDDLLNSTDQTAPVSLASVTINEVSEVLNQITGKTFDPSNQTDVESKIQFNSSFMYQDDILSQLDTSKALSRLAKINPNTLESENSIAKEAQVPASPDLIYQTQIDTRPAEYEKRLPIMFFPFTARHGYQMLQLNRPEKIAYIVGVKNVSFYRRDYSVRWDEDFYLETLDDTQNIAYNDFISNDWQYIIQS